MYTIDFTPVLRRTASCSGGHRQVASCVTCKRASTTTCMPSTVECSSARGQRTAGIRATGAPGCPWLSLVVSGCPWLVRHLLVGETEATFGVDGWMMVGTKCEVVKVTWLVQTSYKANGEDFER